MHTETCEYRLGKVVPLHSFYEGVPPPVRVGNVDFETYLDKADLKRFFWGSAVRPHLFFLPSTLTWTEREASFDWYNGVISQCVRADRSGWNGAWVAEHHNHSFGGIVPCPELLLASVAAQTTRLRLGLGVVILPLHRPIDTAERIAMLDQLSSGRLELGLGTGVFAFEYTARSLSLNGKWQRFYECHTTLAEALMVGSCGAHQSNGEVVRVLPWCHQLPMPPAWIGLGGSR